MGTPLPNSSKQVSRSAKSGISLSPSPWKIWARSSLSIRQKSEKKNGSIRPWRTAFSRQKEAAVEPSRIFASGAEAFPGPGPAHALPDLGYRVLVVGLPVFRRRDRSSGNQPDLPSAGLVSLPECVLCFGSDPNYDFPDRRGGLVLSLYPLGRSNHPGSTALCAYYRGNHQRPLYIWSGDKRGFCPLRLAKSVADRDRITKNDPRWLKTNGGLLVF